MPLIRRISGRHSAGGCSWLLDPPRPAGPVAPGLCVGEAGVAVALLRAGQVLRDPALIEAATAARRSLYQLPHRFLDSSSNGSAGRPLLTCFCGTRPVTTSTYWQRSRRARPSSGDRGGKGNRLRGRFPTATTS